MNKKIFILMALCAAFPLISGKSDKDSPLSGKHKAVTLVEVSQNVSQSTLPYGKDVEVTQDVAQVPLPGVEEVEVEDGVEPFDEKASRAVDLWLEQVPVKKSAKKRTVSYSVGLVTLAEGQEYPGIESLPSTPFRTSPVTLPGAIEEEQGRSSASTSRTLNELQNDVDKLHEHVVRLTHSVHEENSVYSDQLETCHRALNENREDLIAMRDRIDYILSLEGKGRKEAAVAYCEQAAIDNKYKLRALTDECAALTHSVELLKTQITTIATTFNLLVSRIADLNEREKQREQKTLCKRLFCCCLSKHAIARESSVWDLELSTEQKN